MNVDDDLATGSEERVEPAVQSENWLAEQIWLITLEEGADS